MFAVSNDITVDTACRDARSGAIEGIRLRLREPRNFLITERIPPSELIAGGLKTGTRIRVVLDLWPTQQSLLELVREWCVAVEVPIIVNESGVSTIVKPERLTDGEVLAPGDRPPRPDSWFAQFEIDSSEVEGQVAVIAYQDSAGEGWCDCWPQDTDLSGARLDSLPKLDRSYTALHGISLGGAAMRAGKSIDSRWIQCCDVRSAVATTSIARAATASRHDRNSRPPRRPDGNSSAMDLAARAVELTAQGAIERHFADSPRANEALGIYYVGKVLSDAPLSDSCRDRFPRL